MWDLVVFSLLLFLVVGELAQGIEGSGMNSTPVLYHPSEIAQALQVAGTDLPSGLQLNDISAEEKMNNPFGSKNKVTSEQGGFRRASSVFKNGERPVMSAVYFPGGGEHINVGAVWDNDMNGGALSLKLDVANLPWDHETVRIHLFPKESFWNKRLVEGLKNREVRMEKQISEPGKRHGLPPIYRCVLYVEDRLPSGDVAQKKRIEVGAVWGSIDSMELHLQLHLSELPADAGTRFALLLFPSITDKKESATVLREPATVASLPRAALRDALVETVAASPEALDQDEAKEKEVAVCGLAS